MEIDLTTHLGGLELTSPIVVGSCPMTANEVHRIGMISNGAGAIVLPSRFADQRGTSKKSDDSVMQTDEGYLYLIEQIARKKTIPIIASLNGTVDDDWSELPRQIETSGASAIELSLRHSSKSNRNPLDFEHAIIAATEKVREKIGIPLFLKLTKNVTNVGHLARCLQPSVQGLVLFGRSPVVDIELDSLKLSTTWGLTQSGSVVQNLESIIKCREESPQMPLAACGGIGSSGDLIKALIAGANVAMVTSVLYRNGTSAIGTLKEGLIRFMDDHGIRSIDELKSLCPALESVQTRPHQPTFLSTEPRTTTSSREIQGDRFGHPNPAGYR